MTPTSQENAEALTTRVEKVEAALGEVQQVIKSISQEEAPKWMQVVIASATIGLWFVLLFLGVASVWASTWQSKFVESATKVLLPLFNATIVASLTFIFGVPVAKAVARRLSKGETRFWDS